MLAARGNEASMGASENVQVMLEIFRSIERRDAQRFLDLCHSDVEFHWPPSLPYGGASRGRPGTSPTWSDTWLPLRPGETERRMDPRVVAAGDGDLVARGGFSQRSDGRRPHAGLPGSADDEWKSARTRRDGSTVQRPTRARASDLELRRWLALGRARDLLARKSVPARSLPARAAWSVVPDERGFLRPRQRPFPGANPGQKR